MTDHQRQFRIAISYSSENRESAMRPLIVELLRYFPREQIFYDELHTHELARPNPGKWLRETFGWESDLIVIFRSPGYTRSPWCLLEENAIAAEINNDENPEFENRIMTLSMGNASAYGVNIPESSFFNIGNLSTKELAALILKRYERFHGTKIGKRSLGWHPISAWHYVPILFLWGTLFTAWLSGIFGHKDWFAVTTWIFPFFALMYVILLGSRPERPNWKNPPDPVDDVSNTKALLEKWIEYATDFESFHRETVNSLNLKLFNERLLFRTAMWTGMILTVVHIIVQLILKEKKFTFIDEAGWQSLAESPLEYKSHFILWGTYALIIFFVAVIGERRSVGRFRFPLLVGFSVPFVVGIATFGMIVVERSQQIFPEDGTVKLDFALYYFSERLFIIPLICLFVALLGALIQPHLDRIEKKSAS